MIEAIGICKEYGDVQALRNVSLKIGANEVVGLLGPNGAGKTTLMKILTGYLHPTEGRALVAETDVVADPLAVQTQIGYLPENAPVYRDMVVQEYLTMIAELRGLPAEQRASLISQAVLRTGLDKHLVRPIAELSKGYRQRVGLAQAILHRPKVLILDEPTSGLDPSQIVEIRRLIKELAQRATVLLSTHILAEVEVSCERVLIINEGEVRTDARLDALRASSAAIAMVDGEVAQVQQALREIEGVDAVTHTPATGSDFATYRVSGGDADLCPRIYDVVRERGWRLAELRPDRRTLESVFREVVELGGREAGQPTGGAA